MFSFLILCTYLLILIFIFSLKNNKLLTKILFVYTSWMFLVIFISSLNPFNLFDVDDKIYLYWIFCILFMIFFTILFSRKNVDFEQNFNLESNLNKLLKSKFFLWLNIFVFLGLLFFLIRYNNLIQGASAYDLRLIRFSELLNSGFEIILFDYIITGLLKINMLIVSLAIIKKIKSINIIINIICVIMFTMIGFGRMCIFEFCLFLFLSYVIFSNNFSIKKILKVSVGFICCFFIMSLITAIRYVGIYDLSFENFIEYGVNDLFKHLIVYFIGGFRTFEKFFSNYNFDNLMFGRMIFAGFEDFLGFFTGFLNINFSSINNILGAYTQKPVIIGYDGSSFNAFYTALFNFYGDFSFLGILFYGFINGLLLSMSINSFFKRKRISSLILIVYIASMQMCSIYRWNFQFGNYLFILIIIVVFSKLVIRKRSDHDF